MLLYSFTTSQIIIVTEYNNHCHDHSFASLMIRTKSLSWTTNCHFYDSDIIIVVIILTNHTIDINHSIPSSYIGSSHEIVTITFILLLTIKEVSRRHCHCPMNMNRLPVRSLKSSSKLHLSPFLSSPLQSPALFPIQL